MTYEYDNRQSAELARDRFNAQRHTNGAGRFDYFWIVIRCAGVTEDYWVVAKRDC